MSNSTGISWTDATWNPVIGCRHVAPGCLNCYAERMSNRLAGMGQADYAQIVTGHGRFTGRAITRPETLAEPLHWKKPRMVFVNSMGDLFHEDVPFEFIAAVFGVMAACPQHTFQVLTKRPERALAFFQWVRPHVGVRRPEFYEQVAKAQHPAGSNLWPLKNVWLGVSIATQADADKNIPVLLKCPAAVRFVSAEPLLESVNLTGLLGPLPEDKGFNAIQTPGLDWVIIGGESGPHYRAMPIEAARFLITQCRAAGVPCFVKQDSAPRSGRCGRFTNEEFAIKEFPSAK